MENIVFYGFTDNMPPMKRGKVEKALSTHRKYTGVNYHGKHYTFPDWIRQMLKEGGVPKAVSMTSTGKTEYRMYVAGGGFTGADRRVFQDLTKTQYEFALYLINADMVSDEAVEAWRTEVMKKEQEAAEAVRKAEQEEVERHQEQERFEEWLNAEATLLWAAGDQRARKVLDIYEKKIGAASIRHLKLVVAVDHFKNPRCKEFIAELLGNAQNIASRKAFTMLTGVKLPSGGKNTSALIRSLSGSEWEKPQSV